MEREKLFERWLDRELKQLPEVEAPAALVHRVMLGVHRRAGLPWYRRPWPAWPEGLQIFSILFLAAVCGLVIAATAYPAWLPGWEVYGPYLQGWADSVERMLIEGAALARGLVVVSEALGRQFFLLALLAVFAGYLCTVALLTACYRLARQKA